MLFCCCWQIHTPFHCLYSYTHKLYPKYSCLVLLRNIMHCLIATIVRLSLLFRNQSLSLIFVLAMISTWFGSQTQIFEPQNPKLVVIKRRKFNPIMLFKEGLMGGLQVNRDICSWDITVTRGLLEKAELGPDSLFASWVSTCFLSQCNAIAIWHPTNEATWPWSWISPPVINFFSL